MDQALEHRPTLAQRAARFFGFRYHLGVALSSVSLMITLANYGCNSVHV